MTAGIVELAPPADRLDLDAIIEDPPERMVAPKEPGKPWLSRKGRRIDFARTPRVYILTGSLRATCRLEPRLFWATI
jgi:hypothetical protein